MRKLTGPFSVLFCVAGVFATSVSANTTDLAMLSDRSAKITVSEEWTCSPGISINLETVDASLFETRLRDIGALFGAVLSKLIFECPTLNNISLNGLTESVEVITARAAKEDGWKLKLDQSSLAKHAEQISARIQSFEYIQDMVSIFAPYHAVPGIEKTSGYAEYARASQRIVEMLLVDPNQFVNFVESETLNSTASTAGERIETALSIVQLYQPETAKRLKQRVFQIRNAALRSAALEATASAIDDKNTIKPTVATVAAHLRAKTPDTKTLGEIDTKLEAWIEETVLEHEQANDGGSLDNVRSHIEFASTVGNAEIEDLLPKTQAALQTASFWFEALADELLVENIDDAKNVIESAGSSYQEIDLILETGLALTEEFSSFGFDAEADELLDFARSRIEMAISDGLTVYKDQISKESMRWSCFPAQFFGPA